MKQMTLQMLVSLYGNMKKLNIFLKLVEKFIKKKIGKQKKGKPRSSVMKMVAGILYYLKSGCQWRLLPSDFGKWRTVYEWYRKLTGLEIFKNLWQEIIKHSAEKTILKVKNVLADGSLILTTSNIEAKSKNPRMKNKNCINRLALTDKNGFPLALIISKGTAHDTNFLIPLVDQAREIIALPKDFKAHADKGFDSLHNRLEISNRGGYAEIPVRNHGYVVPYPKTKDSIRPTIERFFSWVNAFKSLKVITTKKLANLYENTHFVFAIIGSRFMSLKNLNQLIRRI